MLDHGRKKRREFKKKVGFLLHKRKGKRIQRKRKGELLNHVTQYYSGFVMCWTNSRARMGHSLSVKNKITGPILLEAPHFDLTLGA